MCVDVVCVTGMPNNVLVWVIEPDTALVDQSLFCDGELTERGMILVTRAVTAQMAEAAAATERQYIHAVAG